MKTEETQEPFQNDGENPCGDSTGRGPIKSGRKGPLKTWQLILLIVFGMVVGFFAIVLALITATSPGGKLEPSLGLLAYFGCSTAFFLRACRRKRSWPFLLCVAAAFFTTVFLSVAKAGSSAKQTSAAAASSQPAPSSGGTARELQGSQHAESYQYYYSLLNTQEKAYYKILLDHAAKLKSGTDRLDISSVATKKQWETWVTDGKWDDKSQTAISIYTANGAFLSDHPEIFFADPGKFCYKYKGKGGKSFSMTLQCQDDRKNYFPAGLNSSKDVDLASAKLRSKVDEIAAQAKRSGTVYEQIRFVQDYLIDHVTYDKTMEKDLIHTAYGALINHLAVCDGYSYAFKMILDELGVPCVVVRGNSIRYDTKAHGAAWVKAQMDEYHLWNEVRFDGGWYAVDVTWSDSDVPNEPLTDRYEYFLRGSGSFGHADEELCSLDDLGRMLQYPKLSAKDPRARTDDSRLAAEKAEAEADEAATIAFLALCAAGLALIVWVVASRHRKKKRAVARQNEP